MHGFGLQVRMFACAVVAALVFQSPLASAACRTAETESNNTDSAANADVCSGTAISGSISNGNDVDWYKLVVTGPGTIAVSLSHAANTDFDWFFYPATGSYTAYASTTSNPETGSVNVNAAGNYFIRVKRYSGTGSYSLTVTGPLAGSGLPPPTFGTFSVPGKTVGDPAFTLTPPTSNSSGAFTYSSSNTGVATISGSTVTLVAAGTSTITAHQAADATHTAGSTSATLTVSAGAPWPCTLPTGVNLGKVGSTTDRVATTTGGFVLMGGGSDVDAALQWMIGKSGGGDVVVLRSTGTNAYNSYLQGLGTVNSVQTLLVNTTAEGDNACVAETIRRAEMLFIAGGDQQNYIDFFKGRAVGHAINHLINTKRAPVGGTSAGMHIQAQYTHNGGAPNDATVLQNPTTVAITNNFLTNALLANAVTDTHFSQRARQPRLMAFMASTLHNHGVAWQDVRGIACDEATAYALDANGSGKVFGSNACFFAKATGAPEVLAAGSPLTWNVGQQALNVYRVPGTASGANTFNMNTFTGTGGTTQFWSADRGTFTIR
ncbi:MAG: pre-peptidase C-terminal domain-containing protein [Betaproteobacteria bacterium]|nr:pre-peptidase C-terminal domain-containing protein [Betaproteobacteria bacterium]